MTDSFKSFEDVIFYLEKFTNLEKHPDNYNNRTYRLDRMTSILKHIGNPEESFKSIHVAGSKGKGSVSVMIAKAVNALGFKCGLYTSPHLIDYRERFTIAGNFISDDILIKTGEELKEKMKDFSFSDNILGDSNPTSFELYTAFAYLLFKNTDCKYAVIETGLGGRLDATNTLDPIACVLTPVELEHTSVLGNTIELIATEKSKIIKPNAKCFFSFQKPSVLKIFKDEADFCKTESHSLEDYVERIESNTTKDGEKTEIKWKDNNTHNLNLSLKGHVQAENAALTLLVLKKTGFAVNKTVLNAIEQASLPGHFERIEESPDVYIDGAHTVKSLTNLINSFKEMYDTEKCTFIFGCLPDKNVDGMSDLIIENFNRIIISKPGTYKTSNIDSIFNLMSEKTKNTNKSVVLISDAKEALSYAKKNTPADSAILIAGSFYLAGEFKICSKQ